MKIIIIIIIIILLRENREKNRWTGVSRRRRWKLSKIIFYYNLIRAQLLFSLICVLLTANTCGNKFYQINIKMKLYQTDLTQIHLPTKLGRIQDFEIRFVPRIRIQSKLESRTRDPELVFWNLICSRTWIWYQVGLKSEFRSNFIKFCPYVTKFWSNFTEFCLNFTEFWPNFNEL